MKTSTFLFWLGLLLMKNVTAQDCTAQFSYAVNGFDVLIINESSAAIPRPNYVLTSDSMTIYKDEFFDTTAFHYTHAGVFEITLYMFDADSLAECSNTFTDTVTVIEPPICEAKIQVKYPAFSSESNGVTETTTYFWDFGDGSTSILEDTYHAFVTAGNYTVSLTITDSVTGCIDTAFVERYFYPTACKGALSYQQDSNMVYFTPKFIPQVFTPSSITFDYGDGTQGTDYFHQYDTSGIYLVCCVATDSNLNCTTSNICKWVNVICNTGCTPEFAYAQDCGIVSFENGIIYTAASASFTWDFGDGTSAKGINPKHDYEIQTGATRSFNACLQLTDVNNCDQSICHTVEVSCITTNIVENRKDEIEISNLQLFPVPFSSQLYVNFTILQNTPLTIAIYNSLGQKVVDINYGNQPAGEKNISLDVSNFTEGLYILKMASQNGQLTRQVIKQ